MGPGFEPPMVHLTERLKCERAGIGRQARLRGVCLWRTGSSPVARIKNYIIGVDSKEVPPVPIPNTEVKLFHVENTWLATAWKDR